MVKTLLAEVNGSLGEDRTRVAGIAGELKGRGVAYNPHTSLSAADIEMKLAGYTGFLQVKLPSLERDIIQRDHKGVDEEVVLEDSTRWAEALDAAGVAVGLEVYPRMGHDFVMYSEGCGGDGAKPLEEAAVRAAVDAVAEARRARRMQHVWWAAQQRAATDYLAVLPDRVRGGFLSFPPVLFRVTVAIHLGLPLASLQASEPLLCSCPSRCRVLDALMDAPLTCVQARPSSTERHEMWRAT